MNEAGKVKFVNVSGNHLEISISDMKKYVVPYLIDQASKTQPVEEESSTYTRFSSFWNHLLELAGLTDGQLLWLRSVD